MRAEIKQAILYSIQLQLGESETLKDALKALMLVNVANVKKGSKNNIVTSTSRSGQSVTYSIPAGNYTDDELATLYFQLVKVYDRVVAANPTLTAQQDIMEKMFLEQEMYDISSYYTDFNIQRIS